MRTSSPRLVSDLVEPLRLPPALSLALKEERDDAKALERKGHAAQAASLISFADKMERELAGFAMISEPEAAVFTGLKPRAVRTRYQELERRGLAVTQDDTRFYCQAALTQQADCSAAHLAGRLAARRTSKERAA